ncbi:hypothetical protein C0991_011383 [Blastosporella zonata]|nr:hypothetical protein C0991_011383 [Blastosporella zonata]
MDKTKSRLAAFFDNDEEESSFPQKAVDDAKLSQYAAGTVRKSRREKEQEAAEAKKREEEAYAAKAYAEFIDAFEGQDTGKRKAGPGFVKAGTESNTTYVPSDTAPLPRSGPSMKRSPSPSSTSAPKPKGKRAMDAFLEEIKKFTSNVFVANLPPHVTEQTLGNFFARAGPVGSVKVMWPRTDASVGPGADMSASRRTKSAGLSGFVSFMKRKDAERALREFDGFDWGGSVLRVGWSKAVPIAAKPQYGQHPFCDSRFKVTDNGLAVTEASKSKNWSPSPTRSRSKERRRSRSPARKTRKRSYSPSANNSRSRSRSRLRRSRSPGRRSPPSRGHIEEEDPVTDTFIRAVAAEVKGHDALYEETLREREQNNPKYAFLLNRNHRRHAFYRGLIESEQHLEPEFDDEASYTIRECFLILTYSAEESEREKVRKAQLGRLARRRFESMLRALSGKRGEIARCMAFSLEHAEAAHEVADIIVASLLVDGTAVPRKVARLHLICDILHNSAASVPSAWKFRLEFQSRLGIVFDHLANIYHSFPGRITAETFKKQITAIVDIWEDWIVFPPDFTSELRLRLDGVLREAPAAQTAAAETAPKTEVYASRFKASTFKLATPPDDFSASLEDGEPMDVASDVDGEPVDDIDGDPVDDIDGAPVDDVDGVPLEEDLDGEPVQDEHIDRPMVDVDGAPLDENVDGVSMDESDIDGEPLA